MKSFAEIIQHTDAHESIHAQTSASLGVQFGERTFPFLMGLLELIINSFDAAKTVGKSLIAFVSTQVAGENHLFPNSNCLLLWDTATGIAQEKIIPIGHDDIAHIRHGIGRNGIGAALGENREYLLITRCKYERGIRVYHYIHNNFFDSSGEGVKVYHMNADDLKQSLPIPANGPFTMYLVPDWKQECTMEEFGSFISEKGPVEEWEVVVNDVSITPYEFDIQISKELDVEGFDHPVSVEFGLKPNDDSPFVRLIDKETDRVVAEFKTSNSKLHQVFQRANLTGNIYMEGLEILANSSRTGLSDSRFFQRKKMINFYTSLRIHLLDEVTEMLQLEHTNEVQESLNQVLEAFEKLRPIHTRTPAVKDGTNSDVGRGRRKRKAQVKLYIGGEQFTVSSNASDHPLPAVIDGKIIKLFGGTDFVKRIWKMRDKKLRCSALIGLICMTYASHIHPQDAHAALMESHQITEQVIAQL